MWILFWPIDSLRFLPKMYFLDILEIFRLDMGQISSNLLKKTFATGQHAFLSMSIMFYDIFAQRCAEIKIFSFWMRKWPTSLGFLIFKFFFAFPFSPFLFFLLQLFTFYWACFQFKKVWESIIETGNFYHGVATCSCRKFRNFLSIFVHISGSIEPITLIWVSLERSFPPAEAEHSWCQVWSKVMMSEVEQRPRLVIAGYGPHGSQWVKDIERLHAIIA